MPENRQLLCTTRNGKNVYYMPDSSHTATHFEDNPNLVTIVKDYFSEIDLVEELLACDVDIGKVIGNSNVVGVDDGDEIIYAVRKK
jgi:hypothetical protein